MHTIPCRSELNIIGLPRNAVYPIAMASAGPATKKVSSSIAPVSHRWSGFMEKQYKNRSNNYKDESLYQAFALRIQNAGSRRVGQARSEVRTRKIA